MPVSLLAFACVEEESDSDDSGTGGHGPTGGSSGASGGTTPRGGGAGTEAGSGGQAGNGVITGGGRGGTNVDGGASVEGGASVDGGCAATEPVVLTTEAELRAFAARGCARFDGSILIHSLTLENLDALGTPSALREVNGDFVIEESPLLQSIEALSGLNSVHRITIRKTAVESIELGLIEGGVVVQSNASLRSVSLPGFGGGSLWILENPLFDTLSIEGQHYLGVLEVSDNPRLRTLSSIHAIEIGRATITNNMLLEDLGGIGHYDFIGTITVSKNPKVGSIQFAAYEWGALTITDNDGLASIDLGAIDDIRSLDIAENAVLTTLLVGSSTDIESMSIRDNPMLPQCAVDALEARVMACGEARCTGNDETATCN